MDEWKAFVRGMIDDAEKVLWRELMFVDGDGFALDLSRIRDDMASTQRGWSFVAAESNGLASDCNVFVVNGLG